MFEELLHRVLVGYLGRYVKNIQKDHLKLSLWNGNMFFLLPSILKIVQTHIWACNLPVVICYV